MSKTYAIDIETVSQGARADKFTENMEVKLGNTKDEEKIKAKIAEAKAKAQSRHGLSWITGKLFAVSIINCDDLCCANTVGFTEYDNLIALANYLNGINSGMTKLFAKSGRDFDYPFLVGRYMAHQLPVPRLLADQKKCFDIDDLLTYSKQSSQRGKLSDYAHGLGIDGKLMDGSNIQDMYNKALLDKENQEAILQQVKDYCEQDARIVAEFVRRYYGTN